MNNKLDWEQVRVIKDMIEAGFKNKEIAEEFGVRPNTISDIKCGKSWTGGGLTREQVARVKLLLERGMDTATIAKGFGVPTRVITYIKTGETHTDVEPERFEGEAWEMPNPLFLPVA